MRSGPASNLYAQVPTASGLTAFARRSRSASFVGLGLNFQELGTIRQIAVTPRRDDHYVFQSHAADAKIIKARLDCDYMTALQSGFNGSDPRRLVDVQTQAMARAMKKSLHPAVPPSGFKATRVE